MEMRAPSAHGTCPHWSPKAQGEH